MAGYSTSTSSGVSGYGDCVASLRTSLNFLESSVATLDNGVADYPRLASVLKSVRHYELIPQSTLAAAEASLRDEIGPFIESLLDRVDKQLERQARRIETLKARAELQAGRLSQGHDGFESSSNNSKAGSARPGSSSGPGRRGPAGRKTLDGEAALRARMVRQKKEGLQYSVERLELEVAQKERELRMRLEKAL